MKKLCILLSFVLFFVPATIANQPFEVIFSDFDVLIPAKDAIYYELNSGVPALFSIDVENANSNESFNIFLLDKNYTQIITRFNASGENHINFLGTEDYYLRITNLEEIAIDVHVEIIRYVLKSHEESGYQIENMNYRCWSGAVDSTGWLTIDIDSLNLGKYNSQISVYDDGGKIGVTLSSIYPDSTHDWQENTHSFTATSQSTEEVEIKSETKFMSITSLDLQPHSFTIYFSYIESGLSILEIVIIVTFVVALAALVFVRASSKKRARGTGYYNHKISQKETNEKLKLSAQVDWRFEGSRYAYVPPDIQDPNLVKPYDDDDD
ncbi:MAG: hypothetical protein KGD64_05410 [Candidatus Heimdallarchaeota archaeon]|nr:hypothetical protein [Candidatus Heimdallarchaeota archaeon]